MNRRTFLASLATGAALGAAHKLCGSDDDLTIKLPYKAPETSAKRSAKPTSVDYDALLWAIAEKETGNRDDVVGPCGSRSKYQISEVVWRQHWSPLVTPLSHRNHRSVCKGRAAHATALLHLCWLDANLPAVCERSPRVYHLPAACDRCAYVFAFAWRVGLEGFRRAHANRLSMSTAGHRDFTRGYEYAKAVAALYNDRLRVVADRARLWDSQRLPA